MDIKVLLTDEIRPVGIQALRERAQVVQAPAPDIERILELVGDVDGIISRNTPINERVFARAPRLRVVASHGVGFDHVDVDAATRHGVCVVNTPGANAQSVAELAVGMMIALSRKLLPAAEALRIRGDYYFRNQCLGRDLQGKRVGIAGMGSIGRRLAAICRGGFGMEALGYDPYVSGEDMAAAGVVKVESLDELLPHVDFVSLNCPYTAELHHMMDERRLALMKPTAFLINCARGQLVDEAALCRVLRAGGIAGAALDVFDPEPPARDNPLFGLPGVIATPHIGANAEDSIDRMSLLSARDVLAVIYGAPEHAHVVNREALGDKLAMPSGV